MKTTNNKAQQIVSRLLQTPQASTELKKLWSLVNGNGAITSKERNRIKIGSIARFVIGQSRIADVDAAKVVDVIRGLRGYECPKIYIEELRKFLPELSDSLLHLKASSEIDSTFKRVA